eukprot:SAG31_NODE_42130_length_273_cov_0.580460_1_plen_42_part_10
MSGPFEMTVPLTLISRRLISLPFGNAVLHQGWLGLAYDAYRK